MPATEHLRPGVLIVGVSTRALAVSAARAGYRVTAIDAFGDLDLRGAAATVALRPEDGMQYSPMAAARVAAKAPKFTIPTTGCRDSLREPGCLHLEP